MASPFRRSGAGGGFSRSAMSTASCISTVRFRTPSRPSSVSVINPVFSTPIFRTDIQLITKHAIRFAGNVAVPDAQGNVENYRNLNDFDAIVFYGIGELELADQQKSDLLSFIRDDGKGFVGVHTAITAFYANGPNTAS